MSLYSEFTYMDLSFRKKTKKGFEISFSVADIFHKQSNIVIIHFLWETLYVSTSAPPPYLQIVFVLMTPPI